MHVQSHPWPRGKGRGSEKLSISLRRALNNKVGENTVHSSQRIFWPFEARGRPRSFEFIHVVCNLPYGNIFAYSFRVYRYCRVVCVFHFLFFAILPPSAVKGAHKTSLRRRKRGKGVSSPPSTIHSRPPLPFHSTTRWWWCRRLSAVR